MNRHQTEFAEQRRTSSNIDEVLLECKLLSFYASEPIGSQGFNTIGLAS